MTKFRKKILDFIEEVIIIHGNGSLSFNQFPMLPLAMIRSEEFIYVVIVA